MSHNPISREDMAVQDTDNLVPQCPNGVDMARRDQLAADTPFAAAVGQIQSITNRTEMGQTSGPGDGVFQRQVDIPYPGSRG